MNNSDGRCRVKYLVGRLLMILITESKVGPCAFVAVRHQRHCGRRQALSQLHQKHHTVHTSITNDSISQIQMPNPATRRTVTQTSMLHPGHCEIDFTTASESLQKKKLQQLAKPQAFKTFEMQFLRTYHLYTGAARANYLNKEGSPKSRGRGFLQVPDISGQRPLTVE